MWTGAIDRRTLIAGGLSLLPMPLRRVAAAPARQSAVAVPPSLNAAAIMPGDPAYDQARQVFNGRFDRYPAAVVRCRDAADVQEAVRWAGRDRLPIRSRSGGHSYEGLSTVDGGIVVDLGGMSGVVVDPATGTAAVGAGTRLLDLVTELAGDGLAIPTGTCPKVGVAGLTLGGGIGFLARPFGLTCDHLVAVDLVDGTGTTLRASETEHPDLFWALRGGGGGNLGIATALTFLAKPLPSVVLAEIAWPWGQAPAVFDAWQRWAPFTDQRLTSALALFGPGAGLLSLRAMFTGDEAEIGPLLAPVLAVGTPDPVRWWTTTYLDAATYYAGPPADHAAFKNTSAFATTLLGPDAIATLVEQMRASPADWNLVSCVSLGGAVGAVDPAATAFPHRRALFDLQYQSYWLDPADEAANVAWVRGFRAAMSPYTSGAYVNYLDLDLDDWGTAYFGPNLRRLREVKGRYDPGNLFAAPQGLRPLS